MTEQDHALICANTEISILHYWPVAEGWRQVMCWCRRCGSMWIAQRKPLEIPR